jgi:hypothetical protein
VKTVRLMSLTSRRVCVLVALLVACISGNAGAVIRSPFPVRPTAPYQGHYMMISSDSITASSQTVKPARPR